MWGIVGPKEWLGIGQEEKGRGQPENRVEGQYSQQLWGPQEDQCPLLTIL